MFKKTVRIKSNNQVKASERKNVKQLLLKKFPNITELEADEIFNKKEILNVLKVVAADDEVVLVYTIQKRPLFFDIRGKIFPTIFLLWKYPNMLQSFTTHPEVMTFITSGADLMLPGVITPPGHTNLPKYGNVQENSIAYVNLSNNRAAVAVGTTSQSSASMLLSHGKGKCVNIYHFYGDKLCSLEGMSIAPLPNLGPLEWLSLKSYEEDFPVLGAQRATKVSEEATTPNDENTITPDVKIDTIDPPDSPIMNESNEIADQEIQVESVEAMDELLWYCFLGAIKYSKSLTLPILISNFFKLQMMPLCPPDKTLDIKKTSYKKLKPFLDSACTLGMITVKEIKKGVEAVVNINKDHPKYSEFYLSPENRPKKESDETLKQAETSVTESYIVTQNVLPIFEGSGLKKGDTIQGPDIRKYVTKYVKDNECQENDNNPRLITPKYYLKTICRTENNVTWEELMEKVCAAMKNCYKVSAGNEEIFNKGKISPISMSVSVRSYNKKVTLVDNLELFGINMNEFSKDCQHGVAASTSITPKPPGKQSDQLLVQGNQIIFIYNLLTEKYKIPKKFIRGLENAPKKKK